MRDLFQTSNVKFATLAAVLTSLACYPRLTLWLNGHSSVWYFELALFWCSSFLWGVVFAWHQKYSGKPVFVWKPSPKLWLVVTAIAAVAALLMRFTLDSRLRELTPQDYPKTLQMWLAMTLFTLALDQLFLTFASFAFFIRLVHKISFAVWGTILFGLLVMALKLSSSPKLPPIDIIIGLTLLRIVGTYLALQFYLRGGVLLVWWWTLVYQSRHLLDL